MTTERHEEELVRRLLAPLERVEPVTLVSNDRGRRRRLSTALVVACVLLAGGLAAAAVSGPLSRVFSTNHARRAVDVLDPVTATMLKSDERRGDRIGVRLLGRSRLIRTLPLGRRVYLVPTSKGQLCVVVARLADACGEPLTQAVPLTFAVVDADQTGVGEGPVAYGVAREGAVSVSFTVGGRRETAQIHHGVFAFQGRATDRSFSAVTVRFADGKIETVH